MKTPEEILEMAGYNIEELEEEGTILFRNPDYAEAIVGVTDDFRVVYDIDLMAASLAEEDNISLTDAFEFIDYNTLRTLPYINGLKPIVMYPLERM